MEFVVIYESAEDLIRIRATGRAEQADFIALIDAGAEEFEKTGCRRFLSDYRGLDAEFDHFDVTMLRELAEYFMAVAADRGHVASALVCADGMQFALTRVWEVLARRSEDRISRGVFLDAEEARRWLDTVCPPRSGAD